MPQAEEENRMHRDPIDHFALRKELVPYLPYVDKTSLLSPGTDQEPLPEATKRSPWIDFNVIRNWITVCNNNHQDHCLSESLPNDSPWHGPLWLIDAVDRRLVPAEPGMKYFALSYVWGKSKRAGSELFLQRSNLEWMQQEGSLHVLNDGESPLPQLIDDVIELVARLSWRYIWIDRYCIVQDDGPAKDAQINAMNSIYAGAYATIVAADGDAESGIKGIKGHNASRGVESIMDHVEEKSMNQQFSDQNNTATTEGPGLEDKDWLQTFRESIHGSSNLMASSATAQTLSRVSSFDSFDSFTISDGTRQQMVVQQESQDRKMLEAQAYLLMHSPWYSRGWTFQEALFSRRKIVFQNDSVNWECHCTAWYEGQERFQTEAHKPCVRRPGFSTDSGFEAASWPDLYRYARLVCLFNRRLLTFHEDALYAFAGVMSSLSRTFMYSFISGLPQMFFHSTLIWQPYRPLTRRKSQREGKVVLPSWSWAGWQGVIQYESWRSGYSYIKSLATEKDLDVTTWKTYETVKWHRLDDTGAKHSIKAIDSEKLIATCHRTGWGSTLDVETGKTIYHHKNFPDTDFWQPVTLRDPIKAHVPPMYCQYITTRTSRAHLICGDIFDNAASRCKSVDLKNDSGEWVGVLRMMTDEPPNAKYELIELSAGSVEKETADSIYFDEWERPGLRPCWRNNKYEFYNVMAISTVNGIAYREAVGRVEKRGWEGLEKISVEIILG